MQQTDSFDVLNIRRFLESDNPKLGEAALREYLSEFSCPLNPEVERFLKEQAIDFAKKHQAVTYLVVSQEDNVILGYFAITIKPLVVNGEPFSNTVKRKFTRFSEINKDDQTYNMAAYLIAQLGKNFSEDAVGRITGTKLLEAAISQVQAIQYQAGGMVSFVEAENKEKVLNFYTNYGYKRFASRKTTTKEQEPHELIQLLHIV